jgi:hypothetical protein
VVHVRVGDQHQVDPLGGGRDHRVRHVAQAGVDQQRALGAGDQVLADVALAEVALEAVDSGRDLHAAGMMP